MGGNFSSSWGASDGARQPQATLEFGGGGGEDQACAVPKLPVELTSKYEVLEKIGSGSFGAVYKVRRLESRVLYAAKYVECKDNMASEVSNPLPTHPPPTIYLWDAQTPLPSLNVMLQCFKR